MMKQQEEIQQVYDKYGTSMSAGCLPLLIQMPLLFALYPVIYNIQKYVPEIKTATKAVNVFLTLPDLTISPMQMIKNRRDYGICTGCYYYYCNLASDIIWSDTVRKYQAFTGYFRTAA